MIRDQGCRFPGCTNRHVDGHHIEHWIHGGETKLSNLVALCRRHHRFVHELGYAIEKHDRGQIVFLDPRGKPVPSTGERNPIENGWGRLRRAQAARGLTVTPGTNLPHWDPRPPDYDLAITAVWRADTRATKAAST